jgi:hypothetical protein
VTWRALGLVLALSALSAAGCGSAGDETAPPPSTAEPAAHQTTALEGSEAPTTTGATEAPAEPEGEPDVIMSPAEFRPVVSFTATNPRHAIVADGPESFTVTFSVPSGEITFANDRIQFQGPGSQQSGGRVKAVEVDTSVDGVVAWFEEHPRLEATDPQPVTIGGAEGVVFELTAAKPYDHPACGQSRCVFLWSGLNGTYALLDDDRALVYVLDADGETVMVFVSSGADVFDEVAADADEMLATLSFG